MKASVIASSLSLIALSSALPHTKRQSAQVQVTATLANGGDPEIITFTPGATQDVEIEDVTQLSVQALGGGQMNVACVADQDRSTSNPTDFDPWNPARFNEPAFITRLNCDAAGAGGDDDEQEVQEPVQTYTPPPPPPPQYNNGGVNTQDSVAIVILRRADGSFEREEVTIGTVNDVLIDDNEFITAAVRRVRGEVPARSVRCEVGIAGQPDTQTEIVGRGGKVQLNGGQPQRVTAVSCDDGAQQ